MQLEDANYKSLLPEVTNAQLVDEFNLVHQKKSTLSRRLREVVVIEFTRRVFIGEIVIKQAEGGTDG